MLQKVYYNDRFFYKKYSLHYKSMIIINKYEIFESSKTTITKL